MPDDATVIHDFIARWERSGAAERANYQLFLAELCDVLDVPRPEPTTPDDSGNAYVFERAVHLGDSAGTTSGKPLADARGSDGGAPLDARGSDQSRDREGAVSMSPPHRANATTAGRIDLYKRGCFVLEAKQGVEKPLATAPPLSDVEHQARAGLKKGTARRGTQAWDDAMLRARGQADQYIRALPPAEGRPPFLVVVDVGHSLELYSEFSCTGGAYIPFPDPVNHRIFLRQLERPDIRERLRQVWTDPHALDPSRRSARVTREIAEKLARLAKTLEDARHDPHAVAAFLMRCLFTMFAEDVWLLGKNSFRTLLESLRETPEHFVPMVEELWQKMNTGGFSTSLRQSILQFNGGIFADSSALPLNRDQLLLLGEAAACDWRDVEPAIFGTLLVRALDPVERHKLGAHYTPRAYVERLVLHTIMEPLREEWTAVQAAAVQLANQGKARAAVAELRAFHKRLCGLRILDPACGSVNFLYVAFEHLKRLEGEVFDTLAAMGERQMPLEMPGECVFPNQFLGLEVNPRAAAIAELVLWIGALQWHYRTRGSVRPPQPIIRNFHNIECRDAVLVWDATEPVLDAAGQPRTHWDGRTTKLHPVTGRHVPDETARVPVLRYLNPRPAAWPDADFIVGNPPFIGAKYVRENLGDGYAEALRSAHPDIAESSDFVMYWWNHAAELVRSGKVRRFGFVCTNSLRQKFNRRVLERHLAGEMSTPSRSRLGSEPRASASGAPPSEPRASASGLCSEPAASPSEPRASASGPATPLSLVYAIPDHPWVDEAAGAAVRIAMAVGAPGKHPGLLQTVIAEKPGAEGGYDVTLASRTGMIHADLTIGADSASAEPLKANEGVCCRGVQLMGSGFIVTPEQATALGLGRVPGLKKHIRPYRNGRDLTATPRQAMVIDLFGLTADEVRARFPEVYQWVYERVKPERDQNNRASYRDNWWVFGEPRRDFRPALAGPSRYIATPVTAKHRVFSFLPAEVLPDDALMCFASCDALVLGELSSRVHVTWALSAGARLGVGNDPRYIKTRCFEPFPFPVASEAQQTRIRELAEQLDAHRKRQQALHPALTLTGMYNVLEKLRAIERQAGIRVRVPASAGSVPLASACGITPAAEARRTLPPEGGTLTDPEDGRDTQAGTAAAGRCPPFRTSAEEQVEACTPTTAPPAALTPKEREIHEHGLVSVLKQLHDELDAAVFAAYGWPATLDDAEILERLVALNGERAEEEATGLIRWLRPEYQCPGAAESATPTQAALGLTTTAESATAGTGAKGSRAWPKGLSGRMQAVRAALGASPDPVTAGELAARFGRPARTGEVADLLETLADLGHVTRLASGRYAGH